jgi:hypothetical protein
MCNLVERACGKTLLEPRFPMIGVLPKRTSINWFGGLKNIIGSLRSTNFPLNPKIEAHKKAL